MNFSDEKAKVWYPAVREIFLLYQLKKWAEIHKDIGPIVARNLNSCRRFFWHKFFVCMGATLTEVNLFDFEWGQEWNFRGQFFPLLTFS